MFPEPVSSIITLTVILLVCVVGIVIAVRTVIRAAQMRNAPPSGLLRAGDPGGTDDPAEAARRGQGLFAWTRIGGGF